MASNLKLEIRGGDETVLLVSPDAETRSLGAFMLTRLGYQVLEARNAQEAERIYDESGGEVDLLVTEAVMTRINGHELADGLRSRNPALRILFLSDAPYERLARSVAAQRRLHFLVRPFLLEQLSAKIREALDAPAEHPRALRA
jgi:two-component system, cell cycle sensor histidine kinase and response regulator CckA